MKSLRLRVALWFAVSVAAVMAVFVAVTFTHLRHELRIEKWERFESGPAPWALHGSYTDAEVADIVRELWYLSLLYAVPALLLAMGAGYIVARRALRPVADMNCQLQKFSATSLSARVDVAEADHEIREIAQAINGLLVRLETSFAQLTDFSAQVAHELRTPLTLMRLQIEDAAGRIEPALAEAMQEELARLSDYVDQCLLLATAEQGRLTVQREELAFDALVRDVLEAYSLLAQEEQRSIRATVADCRGHTDPRYARQLLHILLSNAIRHGTGEITVDVREDASGGARCEIQNAIAPGSTPASRGHGLGQRLARALCAALGARLELSNEGQRYRASLVIP